MKLSNALKAALWTALWTFLATAITAVIGFLQEVSEWIAGTDTVLTDDLSNLGRILMAGVIAFLSGLFNWAFRAMQASGVIGGEVPDYKKAASDVQPRE